MPDKLKYIPNNDTQNYHFCTLQLVIVTFEHSTKKNNQSNSINVSKIVKPTDNKKLL